MRESGKLPASDVPRQEQHAFATLRRAVEVLVAVVSNGAAYVLTRIFREQADFGKLASERGENAAHNLPAFAGRFLRERERQVAHADATKLPVHEVDQLSQADANHAR